MPSSPAMRAWAFLLSFHDIREVYHAVRGVPLQAPASRRNLSCGGRQEGARRKARDDRRKGGAAPLRAKLHPHDLDVDTARSGPVQLGEEDRLETAQRQLPAADADGDATAEQRGAEMRVRVATLAV